MTIVFLQPDGVPITAQAERQGSAALYGGGSGRQLGGRSGFRVGTPSDTLTATSTTWTLKPCAAMIDPGASTHQGMYGWASDANITGAVTASDATYARKDIVYIQVNDSTAGDGSGATNANPAYLAGTPSATPAAPALPARSFLVGTIDVPKTGAGSPTVTLNPARFVAAGAPLPVTLAERDALTKYDGLTVQRMDIPGRPFETWNEAGATWGRGVQHVEFTFNAAGVPDGTLWGPGALALDTGAASTDTTLASSPSADMIQLNKGTYSVAFLISTNRVSTGISWVQVRKGDDSDVYAHGAGNEVWASTAVPNLRVTADNTQLRMRLKWSSGGAVTITGRVRITKIG